MVSRRPEAVEVVDACAVVNAAERPAARRYLWRPPTASPYRKRNMVAAQGFMPGKCCRAAGKVSMELEVRAR